MTVNLGEMKLVRARRSKVRSVLRVTHGDRWVGDILIDAKQRIWRHADTIPRDVVFKVLFAFTRQAEAGAVIGRDTGWTYAWQVAA
jgi:hypothetical protein